MNTTFRSAVIQKLIAILFLLFITILIARSQTVEIVKENNLSGVSESGQPRTYGVETIGVMTDPAQPITPAEVFAQMCERDEAKLKKAWAEPTPLPLNALRDRIENPFGKPVK